MSIRNNQAPMIAVLSHLIKAAGPKGLLVRDLEEQVKQHHTQWKPDSVSPAVSYLVRLGVSKEDKEGFGPRRIIYVRDYDMVKDRKIVSKMRAQHKTKSKVVEDSGVKMLFALGKDQTMAATFEEAETLYRQLHKIFGRD